MNVEHATEMGKVAIYSVVANFVVTSINLVKIKR